MQFLQTFSLFCNCIGIQYKRSRYSGACKNYFRGWSIKCSAQLIYRNLPMLHSCTKKETIPKSTLLRTHFSYMYFQKPHPLLSNLTGASHTLLLIGAPPIPSSESPNPNHIKSSSYTSARTYVGVVSTTS